MENDIFSFINPIKDKGRTLLTFQDFDGGSNLANMEFFKHDKKWDNSIKHMIF